MNFNTSAQTQTQFQIAPMIDVVFLLLIFFVASYTVAQEERLLDIALPEAQSGQPTARSLREIVVNMNRDGDIYVNRQRLSPEALEERLVKLASFSTDPGIIIRADGDCDHRHVIRVMDICARVKIERVFFSALPEKQGGGSGDL